MFYKLAFHHRRMCSQRFSKPEVTACTYQPAVLLRHRDWRERPSCLAFLSVIWGTRVYHKNLMLENLCSANILNSPPPKNTARASRMQCHQIPRAGQRTPSWPLSFRLQSSLLFICANWSSSAKVGKRRFLASKLPQLNTNKARRKRKLNSLMVIIIKQYPHYIVGTVPRCLT